MLHFSWNNHTVFQTPKGMPKLDNTSLPPPQLSPHATPPPPPCTPPLSALQPTNPPATHSSHARIPWSPVLIWVETFWALSSGLGRGRGRALSWHKGGRRRSSEHSQLFLNKDMSGIQAPLPLKSLSFHSPPLEHTLVSTRGFIQVIGSERCAHRSTLAAPCGCRCRRASVFSALIAQNLSSLFSCRQKSP